MEGTPLIRPSTTDHPLYDQVVRSLPHGCSTPRSRSISTISASSTIEISDEGDVAVAMSPHRPGCPVAGEMPGWVGGDHPGSRACGTWNVDVVWEPQWGMDMMSDEARLELGFM